MHTECTPHAHCVHTACTLHAHCMHTAYAVHVHHACAPCLHQEARLEAIGGRDAEPGLLGLGAWSGSESGSGLGSNSHKGWLTLTLSPALALTRSKELCQRHRRGVCAAYAQCVYTAHTSATAEAYAVEEGDHSRRRWSRTTPRAGPKSSCRPAPTCLVAAVPAKAGGVAATGAEASAGVVSSGGSAADGVADCSTVPSTDGPLLPSSDAGGSRVLAALAAACRLRCRPASSCATSGSGACRGCCRLCQVPRTSAMYTHSATAEKPTKPRIFLQEAEARVLSTVYVGTFTELVCV